jgi:hypothetical protein
VAPNTHGTRVAVARDYLIWGLEQTLYSLDVTDERISAIRERCELIRRSSIEFKRPGVRTTPPNQGLQRQLPQELIEISHPESALNPFSKRVRFRN